MNLGQTKTNICLGLPHTTFNIPQTLQYLFNFQIFSYWWFRFRDKA